MKQVFRYFWRIKNRAADKHPQVHFEAPDRKAYAKVVKQVVEKNKEALEALRDR